MAKLPWIALLVLLALGCGPPQSVRDARAALQERCAETPSCGPGQGTCLHDPEADALVCLCDHGCYYPGED